MYLIANLHDLESGLIVFSRPYIALQYEALKSIQKVKFVTPEG